VEQGIASGFPMMFTYFFFSFLYPVHKVSTRKSVQFQHMVSTILYFNELNQDSTLERSFFDFLNSYLTPLKNYEKWDFNY